MRVFSRYTLRGMDGASLELPGARTPDGDRREHVLAAALLAFARYGYRKTSMEEVARVAGISRPGLYFLFHSKPELFRVAVTQALDLDVASAEKSLTSAERPLRERLLEAFDQWTGRYIGPMTRDIASVMAEDPHLLGSIAIEYPRRFARLITAALTDQAGPDAGEGPRLVAQTLLSTAIGIKNQVETRQQFLDRLAVAIDLLLR